MIEVARGTYRYWRDATLQPITEPWRLDQHGPALRLTGQRMEAAQTLLDVDAQFRGAECVDLRVTGCGSAESTRTVQYRHRGASMEWQESGDVQSSRLPPRALLFPLLRVAAGPLLLRLADHQSTVVVPNLRVAADHAAFLSPLVSQRRAARLADEGERGRHYRYFGGEYGEDGSDYWLDRRGVVLRYLWSSPQGHWDVRLEELQVSPDFVGFDPGTT